jgi:hypothetical protein
MKSYHVNKDTDLAGLTMKEHDIPEPGSHKVLVRMQANNTCSDNFVLFRLVKGFPRKRKRQNPLTWSGLQVLYLRYENRTDYPGGGETDRPLDRHLTLL